MAQKLDIFKVLRAVDKKDYAFYDTLTDEEKKGFTAFLGLKWGARVEGNQTIQHYYLASMNHHANKHLFNISKHPKLQWLTLAAGSPNFGQQRHNWIKGKKKTSTKKQDDIRKELIKLYPSYKEDEIELLSTMVTKKELKAYAKDSGQV